MLKDTTQMTLNLSPYQGLYDVIRPKNHILRRLKENIDFSFVNPMLRKQYCEHFGRPAKVLFGKLDDAFNVTLNATILC